MIFSWLLVAAILVLCITAWLPRGKGQTVWPPPPAPAPTSPIEPEGEAGYRDAADVEEEEEEEEDESSISDFGEKPEVVNLEWVVIRILKKHERYGLNYSDITLYTVFEFPTASHYVPLQPIPTFVRLTDVNHKWECTLIPADPKDKLPVSCASDTIMKPLVDWYENREVDLEEQEALAEEREQARQRLRM